MYLIADMGLLVAPDPQQLSWKKNFSGNTPHLHFRYLSFMALLTVDSFTASPLARSDCFNLLRAFGPSEKNSI